MCFSRKNSYLVVLICDWQGIWNGDRYYKHLSQKKIFRIFGANIELLESIEYLRFQKKNNFPVLLSRISRKFRGMVDIIKIHHQKIFQNFWRQNWIFRSKTLWNLIYFSRISQFFCSKHSDLAPKILKKCLVVCFHNINQPSKLNEMWI